MIFWILVSLVEICVLDAHHQRAIYDVISSYGSGNDFEVEIDYGYSPYSDNWWPYSNGYGRSASRPSYGIGIAQPLTYSSYKPSYVQDGQYVFSVAADSTARDSWYGSLPYYDYADEEWDYISSIAKGFNSIRTYDSGATEWSDVILSNGRGYRDLSYAPYASVVEEVWPRSVYESVATTYARDFAIWPSPGSTNNKRNIDLFTSYAPYSSVVQEVWPSNAYDIVYATGNTEWLTAESKNHREIFEFVSPYGPVVEQIWTDNPYETVINTHGRSRPSGVFEFASPYTGYVPVVEEIWTDNPYETVINTYDGGRSSSIFEFASPYASYGSVVEEIWTNNPYETVINTYDSRRSPVKNSEIFEFASPYAGYAPVVEEIWTNNPYETVINTYDSRRSFAKEGRNSEFVSPYSGYTPVVEEIWTNNPYETVINTYDSRRSPAKEGRNLEFVSPYSGYGPVVEEIWSSGPYETVVSTYNTDRSSARDFATPFPSSTIKDIRSSGFQETIIETYESDWTGFSFDPSRSHSFDVWTNPVHDYPYYDTGIGWPDQSLAFSYIDYKGSPSVSTGFPNFYSRSQH